MWKKIMWKKEKSNVTMSLCQAKYSMRGTENPKTVEGNPKDTPKDTKQDTWLQRAKKGSKKVQTILIAFVNSPYFAGFPKNFTEIFQ
jgi:hypothetical protein